MHWKWTLATEDTSHTTALLVPAPFLLGFGGIEFTNVVALQLEERVASLEAEQVADNNEAGLVGRNGQYSSVFAPEPSLPEPGTRVCSPAVIEERKVSYRVYGCWSLKPNPH